MSKFYAGQILMRLPGGVQSPVHSGGGNALSAQFNTKDISGLNVGDPVWIDQVSSELSQFENTSSPSSSARFIVRSIHPADGAIGKDTIFATAPDWKPTLSLDL